MGMLKENSKLTNGTTSNSSSKASSARFFCKKCKVRVGSKKCIQLCCTQCCPNPQNCPTHSLKYKKEAHSKYREYIAQVAKEKKALAVDPGVFYDPSIKYLGETLVVWDINQYLTEVQGKWHTRRDRGRRITSTSESRKRERKPGCEDDVLDENCSIEEVDENIIGTSVEATVMDVSHTRKKRRCKRGGFRQMWDQLFHERNKIGES